MVCYSGLEACTERLRIEKLTTQHAQQLFEPLQDSRIYTYIQEVPPPTIEALEHRYIQLIAGPDPGAGERWLNWIMVLKNSMVPIGSLQATVAGSNAEIAYVVFPDYWRQGFAREGLCWLLKYLSMIESVVKVLAQIDSCNAASIALIRSVGFKQDNVVVTSRGRDIVFGKSWDAPNHHART